jgi:NADPH-ferrihemoprotein reductase
LSIYYGSQTGTAESFARDLEREGEDHGFKVHVLDLEETEENAREELLKEAMRDTRGKNRAVFLMATYGEGEPTDNAVGFVRFLKSKLGLDGSSHNASVSTEEKKGDDEVIDSSVLAGLEYAVFGLGNKQYEHFNAMGKFVDLSVGKLGGERIIPLAVGDDDDDLEGDFENWKETKFWPAMKEKYVGDNAVSSSLKDRVKLPECQYVVEYLKGPATVDYVPLSDVHLSSKHYFTAVDCPVTLKTELRSPSDDGSTLHIEIDTSKGGNEVKYQTADNLGILPINSNDNVERLAKALNYDLGSYFRLKAAPGHDHKHSVIFPTPCTVYECLARYCDLVGPPRRSELKLLAAYAKDPISKKALLRLASKEGKAEYKEKILDAKMGIVDIISNLCPSIEMPLEHFIEVCPRLQPRYYTISSSSTIHPQSIHVTVSVLKETREDGSIFKGVCSNFLSELIDNGKVRVFVRESTFRLPSDVSKPVIMIGPGTGIAPMRAMLQERSHQKNQQKLPVGENVLYFGCKTRDLDFIYSEELNAFEKEGTLNQMYLAFSREQSEKVYVQHLLAKNAADTWKLIDDKGAYIYVCGGVKMGQDVSEALKKIIADQGNRSSLDAKSYLDQMASNGRFIQELWA